MTLRSEEASRPAPLWKCRLPRRRFYSGAERKEKRKGREEEKREERRRLVNLTDTCRYLRAWIAHYLHRFTDTAEGHRAKNRLHGHDFFCGEPTCDDRGRGRP